MYPVLIAYLNWYYNVTIGVCAALIGLLAFAGEIAKVKGFWFFDKLYFKILIFLTATGLMIWATVQKDNDADDRANSDKKAFDEWVANSAHEEHIRDSINNATLHIRDSVHQMEEFKTALNNKDELIKSNNENFKMYTNVLAKYNLQLDQSNQKISKLIKDSSSQFSDVPQLRFCLDREPILFERKKNLLDLQYKLCNDSEYPLFNLSAELLIFDIEDSSLRFRMKYRFSDLEPIGRLTFRTYGIEMIEQMPLKDSAVFFVIGNFENSFGRKMKFQTLVWTYKNNKSQVFDSQYEAQLKEWLKENNIVSN